MSPEKKEFDWFDRPESRKLLWRLLIGASVVSVLLELTLVFGHGRHDYFGIDGMFGFYALLGFVACTLMILAAKLCGFVLKKPEDFYGDSKEETLPEDIDDALR
tara:strand:+ start:1829 stop:2140 length:312 start_codon:yes stop_codon:yes gene_type:complete